jgi:hypothetical protein
MTNSHSRASCQCFSSCHSRASGNLIISPYTKKGRLSSFCLTPYMYVCYNLRVNIKKLCYIVLVIIVFLIPQNNVFADDWQVRNSRHLIIYHKGSPADYLNQLIISAERYYRSITDNLGFKRFDFWSWDNRCKVYLYPDSESYVQATGGIAWSRAHVDVAAKHIKTYAGQEGFFDTILPHEMAHIIFREFIGFDKKLPLWIDEGIAMLAESDSSQRLMSARGIVANNRHVPIRELSGIRSYASIDPYVFYSQSASIVDFLLNRYGRHNFVVFCRALRDRDDWQDALRRAYRINSIEELESRWLESLD